MIEMATNSKKIDIGYENIYKPLSGSSLYETTAVTVGHLPALPVTITGCSLTAHLNYIV